MEALVCLNSLGIKINDIYTQINNEIQFMEFSNLFLIVILNGCDSFSDLKIQEC